MFHRCACRRRTPPGRVARRCRRDWRGFGRAGRRPRRPSCRRHGRDEMPNRDGRRRARPEFDEREARRRCVSVEGGCCAEPRPSKVEKLVDHARHALAAGNDPAERFQHPFTFGPSDGHLRRGEDSSQGIAQIVPENGSEHLVEAHGLLELVNRRKPGDRSGDMIGDSSRELELVGFQNARPVVVDHEFAHQPPAGDEWDEGQRPDSLRAEKRKIGGHGRVGLDVRHQDGFGALRITWPR